MNIITRGFGEDMMIITRGFGAEISAYHPGVDPKFWKSRRLNLFGRKRLYGEKRYKGEHRWH